jgi:TonB-linked SusC/RagA family outer membrane protein
MRKLRWLLLATVVAVAVAPTGVLGQGPTTVTGRTTGPAGEPESGVLIRINAINVGTTSGPGGNYTLVVPAGRVGSGQQVTITASRLGLASQSRSITLQPGATVTQNFSLSRDALLLEEVVATGAGTESRAERLGTARTAVSAEVITRANEPNLITALAAKAPNVVTTQASGEPGAGTSIRIRGVSTLVGNAEPAIIVDGIIINNAARSTNNPQTGGQLGGVVSTNRAFDLNPDDIQSIEILKGPAATSILGASAGAGGAILITTKRGRPGQTRFTLRSTMQFDEVAGTVPLQTRFGSGQNNASGVPIATTCLAAPTPGCTHNAPTWGPALAAGTPTFNHADELFENGMMWDNTMTASGGTENTTFYMSLGALSHDGFIVTDKDKYQRYTVRLNAEHNVRDNLRVGGNFSYVQTDGSFVSRGNNVNGLLLGALRTPPEFNNNEYLDAQFGLHRSYRFPMPRANDLINANRGFDNPFFAINNHENLGEVGRVIGTLNANWEPLSWLAVNYRVGVDYTSDDRTEALHVSSSGAAAGGAITRWQFYDRILDSNLTATASYNLNSTISGSLSAGQNLNETYFRQIFVNAQTFIAPQPFKLSNTVNRSPPTDAETRRRLEGYFVQGAMDWNDQLFLTARIRNDGASTFGTETNRAWYPGASAAWTFTRTLGIPENILTHGKLRAAYGESGQEPAAYQLQDIYAVGAIGDFNPGSTLVPTLGGFGGLYTGAQRGNPGIKPERVGELDVGADFAFFGDRASLGVSYYSTHAQDVIFGVQVPPSTGVTTVTLNAGEIDNRGWELQATVRPIARPNLSLDISANWARNRNEVVSLGEIEPDVPREITAYSQSFTGSTTHAMVGQPVGVFRGFGWARCGITPNTFTSGGTNYNIESACAGASTGTLFLGANGLPVLDPNERVIGDPNPDWTGGLSAELQFRGVRLSAFLDHRQGGQVFNMTSGSLMSLGVHKNTDIRDATPAPFETFYQGEAVVGPGAGVPVRLGQSWFQSLGGLGAAREHLMEDATFTRLREISLAYTFSQPWVRRVSGLSSIDARVSGRNLKLWTDYTGFDPEVHTGGAAVANRGIDWFTNPTSRAWVISIGLNR